MLFPSPWKASFAGPMRKCARMVEASPQMHSFQPGGTPLVFRHTKGISDSGPLQKLTHQVARTWRQHIDPMKSVWGRGFQ